MAVTTVRELADQTKMPVERLLAQLGEAGVKVADADAPISAEEKKQWLDHLQKPKRSALGLGGGGGKITLKRKEQSELKVSPGRGGRARTVNVEVRKKRTFLPREEELPEEIVETPAEEIVPEVPTAPEPAKAEVKPEPEPTPAEAEEITPEEAAPAEAAAPEAAVEEAVEEVVEKVAEEAPEESEPEPAAAAPAAPATPPKGEPEELRSEISDLRRRVLENLRRAQEQEGDLAKSREEREKAEREKAERDKRGRKKAGRGEQLHVAENKRGKRRKKGTRTHVKVDTTHGFERPTAPVVRDVEVPDSISVGDLAQRMAVKTSDLIKALMGMGMMATINENLDQDTALLVVEELGHKGKPVGAQDQEENLLKEVRSVDMDALNRAGRSPVVTIMGHVDHGKTTLLDFIRKARVAAGEAGGITQHIGAYQVSTDKGTITFLDTPGHAAFTAMRARGAAVTDVVILVVAADDGVMPQTEEAVQHARAGGVPLVVAMTKSDKENADPDKVKNELSKLELIPEDWGGDTQFIPVSGITGDGIPELLDAVLLQSEMLELTAPTDGPAEAVVVESSLERGRGPVATVLVRSGTLHKGDVILAGQNFGRVRALFNEDGKQVKEAGPSCPVQVLGLDGTPNAGDDVIVVTDERKAKELAAVREHKSREARAKSRDRRGDWVKNMGEAEAKELPVLLKCDVRGSAEALGDALAKLSTDEIKINVVANGVGGISESDIDLAIASKALIIGFNTRADSVSRRRAAESGLELRYYSVIYDVINDVRDAASGLLGTETAEKIVGVAMVRDVFRSSKFGAVAGCLVEEGQVRRGLPIRVLRDNVVIYEGELESLRRHKDDVNKVEAGTECGIAVKNYNDVRENDRIEVFERVEVQRQLEAAEA